MANYSMQVMAENLDLMLDNISLQESQEEPLRKFARMNKFVRNILLFLPLVNKKFKISKDIHGFKIKRDNKTYYFKSFTNKRISKFDIQRIRKSSLNIKQLIAKVLEIAGSHELLEPIFIFGTTNDELKFLVEYGKKGKRYIIDIEYDIIMESNDYRELKNLKEISTLDFNQVFIMDSLIEDLNWNIPELFFIMFYDEIVPYFFKLIGNDFTGFDEYGINYKNAHMFYRGCDNIFKYYKNSEKLPEFYDVNDITTRPEYYNCFSKFDGSYRFKNYSFSLWSGNVSDDETKNVLLSSERFGWCHSENPRTASFLKKFFREHGKNRKVNIVSGRCYYKTKRFIYHTWVEFESQTKGKFYVIDFTQNLVMERSQFYKYAEPEVLESIDVEEYLYMEQLFKEYGIKMSHRLKGFFATEFIHDLEKNKSLLMKQMN